jgi:hypothetical protein
MPGTGDEKRRITDNFSKIFDKIPIKNLLTLFGGLLYHVTTVTGVDPAIYHFLRRVL